jgi:hypothetical protein
MPRTKNRTSDKPYVLTPKDAWSLLAATSDYVHTPVRALNGKDRADILAEAALAKGFVDLSTTISAIHSSVMDFHKGNYKAIQYLLEGPAIREDVVGDAKGTGFEKAVDRLFKPLGWIADVDEKLADRKGNHQIDWDASAKVLLKVKKDKFPEDLTMVEKLAVTKRSSTRATPRGA